MTSMATGAASIIANPNVSQWIGLLPDGRFELRVGKVELGQGILTALKQIALEELCVEATAVELAEQTTRTVPNEGLTAGSLSIQTSGEAVRRACRQLRRTFLAAASHATGIPLKDLRAKDGSILDASGRTVTTYAAMRDSVNLDVPIVEDNRDQARRPPVAAEHSLRRLDLPEKILGRPVFIQDMNLPGMLHARIIHPSVHHARLSAEAIARLPRSTGSASIFRDGDFIAVISESEATASREAAKLSEAIRWEIHSALPPGSPRLASWIRGQSSKSSILHETSPVAPGSAGRTRLSRSYSRPYIAHASIAPSCALARWIGGKLDVWTHSQSIFHLRDALARALALSEDAIEVRHVQSAGCYGHNGADDAAFDAALLAMQTGGRPVRVLWSRVDEFGSAPAGSAMTAEVSASLGAGGVVSNWNYEVWGNGFLGRPGFSGTPAFLGESLREGGDPLPPSADASPRGGHGIGRNAVPAYAFNGIRVARHRLLTMPIRTSALRALGAHFNVFAIESFMDELAVAGGHDPVEFRLAKLDDERAKCVIRRAAELAAWGHRRPEEGLGRGIAYARYKNAGAYCAVVAEVEAGQTLKAHRLVVVVDAGRIVSLDGVLNQIEGGALQALSWTLKEEVKFDASGITTVDWDQYPILKFSEVPRVEASVIDRRDAPSLGVGECAHGPVAAALANALFDALKVRVRDMPLSNENIMRAIDESSD